MTLTKNEFTTKLVTWLMDNLKTKYPDYQIDIVVKPGTLSKASDPKIKKIENYSFLEFEPDVIAILEHKTTKEIELVLLNRELKTYGVREIGEMLCFCRLTKPKHAFMVSLRGLSPDVNKMINHEKNHDIITFDSKTIKIFRWDETDDSIDKLSITPIGSTSLF
jgi:hypothetical protein